MSLLLDHSKAFSGNFLDWARGKGRVLIVSHDNPDPDSLAAAFALKHLFLVKNGQEATITFGGIIGRSENRVMVRELEIGAVPIDFVDLDHYGMVCMVDTQPGTGNNSYPADRPVHLVVDHHPLRPQTDECRWIDVRVNYGASATILFEYLVAQEISLSTKLATILFYAIKSETQDLGREWAQADREAYLHLIPLVNNHILFKITHPKVPREYFYSYNRALENAKVYDQVLVFNLYDIDNPDIVAEMADFLVRMQGVETVLGMGRFESREILSLRTQSETVIAGDVIQNVLGDLGPAGGHAMIAGGQIRYLKGERAVQKELESSLTRRLLEALGMDPRQGRRLISS
ncbi:MAG TPA: DHH family phosphoesterase [Desulfuromonadales bacterium]|nr:DHH family phosphoesterase [Desulfuromonadales bacterium]